MLLINQNLQASSRVSYSLTCSVGSYSVTGINATFTLAKKLIANNGTYAYVGRNASFIVAKKLIASAGAYTLTGQNATLNYVAGSSSIAYSLVCDLGQYSVLGKEAQLIFTPAISQIISRGGFKAKTEYKDKRKEVEEDIARAIEKVTGVPELKTLVKINPVNMPSKVQELVMQAQITALQIEITQLTEAELDDEEILMLLL
jgi:hypothetical protein